MEYNITFKFVPRQFVTVTKHELNYAGRVIRCIWEKGHSNLYEIDYVHDGKLIRQEFYEDELEAI
jgi:hypothetical protein